jgi:hypothetical protein
MLGSMRTRPTLLPLLCLGLFLGVAPAGAEDDRDFRSEPEWKALQAAEAKALGALLKQALKDDLRRQAWYLADRILAAKPGDAEATAALEKWTDVQLMEGMTPSAEFVNKRDKALTLLGDEYAKLAEKLEAAQVDPTRTYPLQVRAHAYGAAYGALHAAFQGAGYVWLGTFLDHEKAPVIQAAQELLDELAFPSEYDDAYLKVRVRWPEARCVTVGPWRLVTDLKPLEAIQALVTLEHARRHLVQVLGGGTSDEARLTDVVLASEAAVYDKIGPRLVTRPEDQQELQQRSSWYDRRIPPESDRLLVCSRDRHNGFAGEHAALLHAGARVIARQHFAQKSGGWVQGRGSWLVEGLGGALEGYARDPKTGSGEIDPSRCWRLAAAKALQGEGVLLSWDRFLEVDAEAAKAWPRRTVKLAFHGTTYEAKEVDVAAAQATAFVVGVMKADKGKGARKLGDLLRELMKRDSLPDLDKTLGWKKGRWQAEADKALEAATGK